MMGWLRWYHNTAGDPKLGVIARAVKQPRVAIVAIWTAVLEHASSAEDRGSIAGLDPEEIAIMLDLEPGNVTETLIAMTRGKRPLISGDRITNWERRQPASDDVSERVRKHRLRKKVADANIPAPEDETLLKRIEQNITDQNRQDQTTSSSPTPPVSSEPEPPAASGGGLNAQFFEIDLRGQQMREDEWIFRCLLEARRAKKLSVMGCNDLKSLLSLYPNAFDLYRRWILKPPERRMAAFVYTALHSTADDPFRYALKAIEEGQEWDKMPGYLRQTTAQVRNGDLKVVITDG